MARFVGGLALAGMVWALIVLGPVVVLWLHILSTLGGVR